MAASDARWYPALPQEPTRYRSATFVRRVRRLGEPQFRQLEPDGGLVEANRRASQRSVSPRDGWCVFAVIWSRNLNNGSP